MPKASQSKKGVVRSADAGNRTRDAVLKEWPRFNPVVEMIRIAKKPKRSKADLERFDLYERCAAYLIPKPKAVDVNLKGDPGSTGAFIFRWDDPK